MTIEQMQDERKFTRNQAAQQRIHIVAIQSYNYIGKAESRGSELRIAKATDLIRQGVIPQNSIMVWPQGYGKDHPTYPTSSNERSLGQDLRKYAEQQDPAIFHMFHNSNPMSWGTKNDILASIRMAADILDSLSPESRAHFHFVSDPAHLVRIQLVWFMVHPKGWTASFHKVEAHKRARSEVIYKEVIGSIVYFFALLPTGLCSLFLGRKHQDHFVLDY